MVSPSAYPPIDTVDGSARVGTNPNEYVAVRNGWIDVLWFEMQSWASLANSWKRKASRQRRQLTRAARQLGSVSERLEDRHFLSAIAVAPSVPEVQEVSTISAASEAHHAKKFKLNLTGDWAIDTPAGRVNLSTQQHGKRIRGTANLDNFNLASLLNSPVPLPVEIDVPPVEFKGKFKKGVLNVNFETLIPLPISAIPPFKVTGNITAQVNLLTGITGHLIVNVNGNQVLSTDFTSPLPSLGG